MIDDEANDHTHSYVLLKKGTMVLHYRIIEKIGSGGMGEVFLAEDTKLNRTIALKFMPAHLATDKDMQIRFTREAQAAAKLDHPNIVPVYEVNEFEGRPFIAMAHIKGESLRHFIKKSKISISESIDLAKQICEGLNEAHNNGIVHRDVKPGNILIDKKGRARILDFGLATVAGEDKLTKTGSTLGTIGYMAPEQILGKKIDKRADLFSVGVILYEMITGRRPFEGDTDAAVIKAITDEIPEPITRYKSGITAELQSVIDKSIAKDPAIRYQHADSMLADLKRLGTDPIKSKKSYKIISWIAAVLIAIIGTYFIPKIINISSEQTINDKPVLIVLPFDNLGSDEDEYFADGIRDEIGSRLSTIKGLRVISPRSADKYKNTDKSAEQIGSETGADYILEATIRWDKSGEVDRIRLTPRLTKTEDNYLMWADNYEQQLVEIFAVQSKIADQIVVALGLTLVETDKLAPVGTPTTNMAAYNYYLRGLEVSNNTFQTSDFHESITMFDSAIALDSNFALAWAQKSLSHSNFFWHFTTVDNKYHKTNALKAAEKSLALDPNLSSAHIAMGTYYNYIERDYDKALASFNSAKSETVSNADLSQAIGIVKMRQGKWQEALSLFEEAIAIDPLTDRRYFYISNCLALIRDYESADKYIDRALVLDPTNTDAAYIKLSLNLLKKGKLEDEKYSFDKLSNDVGLAKISTYELASSSALGLWRFIIDKIDPKKAIEEVRKLGDVQNVITQRSPHLIHLNIAQIYDLTGHHDSALIHYDSSKIILTNIIDQDDYEFHVFAELGLTYALMGMKNLAIEAGKKAKELMSIDDCHW